ncbi:hypothetical protein [Maricaulis sp.]|uniref:hypothetical protein n=1 Tax=Maricaulis sp. TaxID=1486257 RepID=UPI002B27A07C|nr:hypothetical protein [Maricaulis sp.]
MTSDPAITQLATWLARTDVRLEVAPSDFAILHSDAVDILVHSEALPPLRITVFDEYGDLGTHDALLAIVLIGRGFGEIADAGDAASWALAEGLDPDDLACQTLHQQLCAARSTFLEAWGAIPDVVSDLDWQLNAGIAQTLRRRAGLLPKA